MQHGGRHFCLGISISTQKLSELYFAFHIINCYTCKQQARKHCLAFHVKHLSQNLEGGCYISLLVIITPREISDCPKPLDLYFISYDNPNFFSNKEPSLWCFLSFYFNSRNSRSPKSSATHYDISGSLCLPQVAQNWDYWGRSDSYQCYKMVGNVKSSGKKEETSKCSIFTISR